jgi:cytochrome b involved in lipid metabolism
MLDCTVIIIAYHRSSDHPFVPDHKHKNDLTMAPKNTGEKTYTLEEVSKHTKTEDCWLIIGNASNGT